MISAEDVSTRPLQEQAAYLHQQLSSNENIPLPLASRLHDNLVSFEDVIRDNGILMYVPHGGQIHFHASAAKLRILSGGNRQGKTTAGVAEDVRCAKGDDDKWQMFHWQRNPDDSYSEQSLVMVREHAPKTIWVCVADRPNGWEKVMWPILQTLLPHDLIKRPPTHDDPTVICTNGSTINAKFWATQPVSHWWGAAVDRAHCDEAMDRAHWNQLIERLRTRDFKVWVCATPEEGTDWWLYRYVDDPSLWEWGEDEIDVCYLEIDDVPNSVYGNGDPKLGRLNKLAAWKKWGHWNEDRTVWIRGTEPSDEGMARLYGRFHASSGFCYPNWKDGIHILGWDRVPDEWPRFRSVDHGIGHPAACGWFAIAPDGSIVMYDEYERPDVVIQQTVENIVKQSGGWLDPQPGQQFAGAPVFREAYHGGSSPYLFNILDHKCWARDPVSGRALADHYRHAGIVFRPSTGADEMTRIQGLREWLSTDPWRKHLGTGHMGGPRFYVLARCRRFIWEIKNYQWEQQSPGKRASGIIPDKLKARDHDNDLIDCAEYAVASRPPQPSKLRTRRRMSFTQTPGGLYFPS